MLTMRQVLVDSCESFLVRNVSGICNGFFKRGQKPLQERVNIHNTHYIFFINKTTVSISCSGIKSKVVVVYGLYNVPDQCELHAPDFPP